MIFDIIVVVAIFFEIKSGLHDGFIKGILKTAGYIAGAIAGLYFALQYDKSGWVILAIFFGAGLGTYLGSLVAKALKVTVIRGPLAWVDSLAGGFLQGVKVLVLAFMIGTVLLWAPWSTGQNAVAESKIYLKISTYAPEIIQELRHQIESRLQ
jgi:uncharacterized membrane protein required for colicin V production